MLTLAVLALFRLIENKLPSEYYAHHILAVDRKSVMSEEAVRKLIGKHGFSLANLSSLLSEGGKLFEYRMTIRSRDQRAVESLSKHLRDLPQVKEFRITTVGD